MLINELELNDIAWQVRVNIDPSTFKRIPFHLDEVQVIAKNQKVIDNGVAISYNAKTRSSHNTFFNQDDEFVYDTLQKALLYTLIRRIGL